MSAASSAKEVSISPSVFVNVYRVSPEEDDPTASTFLPMPGLLIVHEVLAVPPSFPAAKINRCSGFFAHGSSADVRGKTAAALVGLSMRAWQKYGSKQRKERTSNTRERS